MSLVIEYRLFRIKFVVKGIGLVGWLGSFLASLSWSLFVDLDLIRLLLEWSATRWDFWIPRTHDFSWFFSTISTLVSLVLPGRIPTLQTPLNMAENTSGLCDCNTPSHWISTGCFLGNAVGTFVYRKGEPQTPLINLFLAGMDQKVSVLEIHDQTEEACGNWTTMEQRQTDWCEVDVTVCMSFCKPVTWDTKLNHTKR